MRRWFERCRKPIAGKGDKYPRLFPPFPGCDVDTGFFATMEFVDRCCREVPDRVLQKAATLPGELAVRAMVDAYLSELEPIVEDNQVDVVIVARPDNLDDVNIARQDEAEGASPATQEVGTDSSAPAVANFHDLLKARALRLHKPLQIMRRSTWDESAPTPRGRSRQDEATRAWNLYVAIYYKAGCVPWRLPRSNRDLGTCYVGVSFYRTADALDTAVAHIFNERGDGGCGQRRNSAC